MKVDKARSVKPCESLVTEHVDAEKLAEDEEINLVPLEEGRYAFHNIGSAKFFDDTGREVISTHRQHHDPRDRSQLFPYPFFRRHREDQMVAADLWQVVICLARIRILAVRLEENSVDVVALR
jgi:hypothetical protein